MSDIPHLANLELQSALSALADGRATPEEMEQLLAAWPGDMALRQRWHLYQVAAQAMQAPDEAWWFSQSSDEQFLSSLRQGLRQEGEGDVRPRLVHRWQRWWATLSAGQVGSTWTTATAMAAVFAVAVFAGRHPLSNDLAVPPVEVSFGAEPSSALPYALADRAWHTGNAWATTPHVAQASFSPPMPGPLPSALLAQSAQVQNVPNRVAWAAGEDRSFSAALHGGDGAFQAPQQMPLSGGLPPVFESQLMPAVADR